MTTNDETTKKHMGRIGHKNFTYGDVLSCMNEARADERAKLKDMILPTIYSSLPFVKQECARQIFAELEEKKLLDTSHYSSDDSWYSCPMSPDYIAHKDDEMLECNCGAEKRTKEYNDIKQKYLKG